MTRAHRGWSRVAVAAAALVVGSLVLPVPPPVGARSAVDRPAISASALDIDVNGSVLTMQRLGNLLFFGGQFTMVNGQPRENLAAIDIRTGALSSFAAQVTPTTTRPAISAVAAGLNASFVGGEFNFIDGAARDNVASLGSSWNPQLTDSSGGSAVTALAADYTADGYPRVFIGGAFSAVDGQPRAGLASIVGFQGSEALTAWNPGLALGGGDPSVAALAVERTGSAIYVGGAFSSVGGQPRANLAAISTAGSGVPTPWHSGTDAPVRSLRLDEASEVLYVGGDFATLGGLTRPGIGAVSTEGAGGTTPWYSGGGLFGCAPGPSALTLNPQRTEVIVGCAVPRFGSALNAVSAAGTGAPVRAYPITGSVYSALMTPTGRLFAGGSFGLRSFAPDTAPALPKLAIATSSVEEGDAGARLARVTVSLSKPVPYQTAAYYRMNAWLATPGVDFVEQSGWIRIPPGSTSGAISVKVLGDTSHEPDESFSVLLSDPQSARIDHGHGQVTITDDDHAPALRVGVGNAVVVEGDESTRLARFTISLSRVSPVPVSVTYYTIPDTAAADSDFTMRWAVATIPAGAMSTAATVPVRGDTTWEEKEGYTLKIIQPRGATLGRQNANGFILNDDPYSS